MRPTSHESRKERGFTLVELLVVIGILAVLAAVVVPSVAQFAGSGDAAAQTTEADSVQSAMDLYMSHSGLSEVPTGSGIEDFSASSTSLTLDDALYPEYLRQNPSETAISCTYSWTADGVVSQDYDADCPDPDA